MNIDGAIQVSPILSAQRTAAQLKTKLVKMANDQIKADGQAALQLIPQASGSVGSKLNVLV